MNRVHLVGGPRSGVSLPEQLAPGKYLEFPAEHDLFTQERYEVYVRLPNGDRIAVHTSLLRDSEPKP